MKKFNHDCTEPDNNSGRYLDYTTTSEKVNNHLVHIREIVEADYYSKIFDLFVTASPNDTVTLLISSGGGDLAGLEMLLSGISLTQARVMGIIVGSAHSAASILSLHCDSLHVTDAGSMMIHNVSFGASNTISNVESYTKFLRNSSTKLIKETYEGFLTPEELHDVTYNNKEIWLDAEEIRERMKGRTAFLESQFKGSDVVDFADTEQP